MSSSEEEVEVESTITETQEEETAPTQRESSDTPGPSRPSRKRKRSDRTASSSLSVAETHRKTRKVAIVYSTDETDEEKIPEMVGEGYAFPRKMKEVKLTLPSTPSQVTLSRTFVEWFSYYGLRQGLREALESRQWDDEMINTLISNFRAKHGFNKHTAMMPYNDEDDSDGEPIHLEGGRTAVLRRRIISPRESSTQEENDRLDDLVSRPKKRTAAKASGEGEPMGPPAKRTRKEKKAKTVKPKKATKPKKAAKPKKDSKKPKKKKAAKTGEGTPTPSPSPTGEPDPTPAATPGGRATAQQGSSGFTTRGFAAAASRRRSNTAGD